jgi:hypothetical protein
MSPRHTDGHSTSCRQATPKSLSINGKQNQANLKAALSIPQSEGYPPVAKVAHFERSLQPQERSMTKTRTQVTAVLAAGAVLLALIIAVSPYATTVANEVSGEVYGVDILGLTKSATNLPEQQFAAY